MSSSSDPSSDTFRLSLGKPEFILFSLGLGLGMQTLIQNRRIQALILCAPGTTSNLSCIAKHAFAPIIFSSTLYLYHYEIRRRLWRAVNENSWGVYYVQREARAEDARHVPSVQKRVTFGLNTMIAFLAGVLPMAVTLEGIFRYYSKSAYRFSQRMMQRRHYAIGLICLGILLDALVDDFSDCFEEHEFLTLDTLYETTTPLSTLRQKDHSMHFEQKKEEEKLGIKSHLKKHIRQRKDEL